jgi:hypothetical protein
MARVLVEHTSTQLFKTMEQAQETLNWIRDNLKKGTDDAPHPNKIIPVEGGFRYITYSAPDREIPVEQFEELKAKGSLPMLFDNQKLVVIE